MRPTLALVGAHGRFAEAVVAGIALRPDRWGEVRLLSPRMSTRSLPVRGRERAIEVIGPDSFDGVDVALFNLPADGTRELAARAVRAGATVVDASAAHRADEHVPLVAPGINTAAAAHRPKGVVALPGPLTWALLDVAHVLHHGWELQQLVVTGFIAADSRSDGGIERLRDEIRLVADLPRVGLGSGDVRAAVSDLPEQTAFPAPLALNVVPWVGRPAEGGWTTAEQGLADEICKVLGVPDLVVAPTLVQVPVVSGHSMAVHARCARPVDVARIRHAVLTAPALVALDDGGDEMPTPVDAVGADPRFVGRIRQPSGQRHLVELFLSADTIRRGAEAMLEVADLVGPPAGPSAAAPVANHDPTR